MGCATRGASEITSILRLSASSNALAIALKLSESSPSSSDWRTGTLLVAPGGLIRRVAFSMYHNGSAILQDTRGWSRQLPPLPPGPCEGNGKVKERPPEDLLGTYHLPRPTR